MEKERCARRSRVFACSRKVDKNNKLLNWQFIKNSHGNGGIPIITEGSNPLVGPREGREKEKESAQRDDEKGAVI